MRPTMRSAPLPTLAALAVSATLAAGCAHGPAAPTAPARAPAVADLFPLALGNEWTWEDQSPSLQGGPRAPPRTVRILEKTADGFFRDSERGELRVAGNCLQDRLRRLLCGPVAAGTSWTSVVSVSSTERYEIAAVGETVVTPAGTFTGCVRVRALNRAAPGTDLVNEISYAPGVGPVRIETFAVAGGQAVPQFKALLRAYKVEGQ